ncbi:MAG: Gmad2 immunoglobulin-like domain-containing protein [Candidatus Saccharimonadales bacterium]
MAKKSKKIFKFRKLYIAALIAVLVLALITLLVLIKPVHEVRNQNLSTSTKPKNSTSSTSNAGNKSITSSTGINQGTATNNQSVSSSVSSDSSKWVVSSSGLLTVKSPVENDKITSGVNLTGVASVEQVQYRLIDAQFGVISQGFIKVVNGTFSANISFTAHSNSGRLDVFSTDPNGREINEVQIQVSF